eukprot:scaffold12908_cov30-Tisochrysis_lutea.AAC.2
MGTWLGLLHARHRERNQMPHQHVARSRHSQGAPARTASPLGLQSSLPPPIEDIPRADACATLALARLHSRLTHLQHTQHIYRRPKAASSKSGGAATPRGRCCIVESQLRRQSRVALAASVARLVDPPSP